MKIREEYTCPLEIVHDILKGKWKTVILYQLKYYGIASLSDLEKGIKGINQKMLLQQLNELKEFGLVDKRKYDDYPLKVEYFLTKERGERIIEALEIMQEFGKKYLNENGVHRRVTYGTKIDSIRNNTHKYSVSAMCGVLNIARSTYYAELQKQTKEQETDEVEALVKQLFNQSRGIYGTRKIKQELSKFGYCVSRRRIGKIMQANKLLSVYTVAQYKVHKAKCNEDKVENTLARQFEQEHPLAVVVSDLTYVRVNNSWNYICLLVDLYNREIIGRSVGKHKDAALVKRAFSNFKGNLKSFGLFHTDRGLEFKNALIEDLLTTFDIQRSLRYKGGPYDNAVAESLYKTLKVEFVRKRNFDTLEQLQMELDDYINWYNCHRIHGTLGYLTPIEYRKQNFINFV